MVFPAPSPTRCSPRARAWLHPGSPSSWQTTKVRATAGREEACLNDLVEAYGGVSIALLFVHHPSKHALSSQQDLLRELQNLAGDGDLVLGDLL